MTDEPTADRPKSDSGRSEKTARADVDSGVEPEESKTKPTPRRARALISLIYAIILLTIAANLALGSIASSETARRLIETGANSMGITFDELRSAHSFFDGFSVGLKNLNAPIDNEAKGITGSARIAELNLKLSLFNFLTGRAPITLLEAHNVTIEIDRGSSPSLSADEREPAPEPTKKLEELASDLIARLPIGEMTVTEVKIKLTDSTKTDRTGAPLGARVGSGYVILAKPGFFSARTFLVFARIASLSGGQPMSFFARGSLGARSARLDIEARSFESASWRALLAGYGIEPRGADFSVDATVSIDVRADEAVWADASAQVDPVGSTDRAPVTIELESQLAADRATIKKGKVARAEAFVRTEGFIDYSDQRSPLVDLRFSSSEIDLTELDALLGSGAIFSAARQFLGNALFREGRLKLTDLRWNGQIKSLLALDFEAIARSLSGSMSLRSARISSGYLLDEIVDLNGDLRIGDSVVTLSANLGMYGPSRLEELTLRLSGFGTKSIKFDAKLKADLDLPQSLALLKSKLRDRAMRDRIDQIESLSGVAKIDLISQGRLDAPEKTRNDGTIELQNISIALVKPDQFALKNVSGIIRADGASARMENVMAEVSSSVFILDGEIMDFFKEKPRLDLRLATTIVADELTRLMSAIPKAKLDLKYRYEGSADIAVAISGSPQEPIFELSADLTGLGYEILNVFRKSIGHEARLSAKINRESSKVSTTFSFDAQLLELGPGGSSADLIGSIRFDAAGQSYDLEISTPGMLIDDLDGAFSFIDDIDSEGIGSGSARLTKPARGSYALNGAIDLTDARFKLPLFSSAFEGVSGSLFFEGTDAYLKSVRGRLGDGKFFLNGSGDFKPPRAFNINVSATELNLDDLFGSASESGGGSIEREDRAPPAQTAASKSASSEEKRDYLFNGPWTINIQSDSGTIGPLDYSNAYSVIRIDGSVFRFDPLGFEAYDGTWIAPMVMELDPDRGFYFQGRYFAQDISIDRFLYLNGLREETISGELDILGDFAAQGKTVTAALKTLNGAASLRSTRGALYKFRALTKIFDAMKLKRSSDGSDGDFGKDGMPFSVIRADFNIRDGVATTENALLQSPSININAKGSYNIVDQTVDLTVGLTPLGWLDSAARSIPIIGETALGQSDTILAGFIGVKGPISDPSLSTRQVSSFFRNAFNIVKRVFALPMKLFKPKVEDEFSFEY